MATSTLLGVGVLVVGIVACTVLPMLWMRRAHHRRMRVLELHAPLLPEYVDRLRHCSWANRSSS